MMFWPLVKEISFKDISIFSSGGQFVQPSRTVCSAEQNSLSIFRRGHHDDFELGTVLHSGDAV